MASEPDTDGGSTLARITTVASFPLIFFKELFMDDVPAFTTHLLQGYSRTIWMIALVSFWTLTALSFNLYFLAIRTLGWLFIAAQIVGASGLVYVTSWLAQVLVMLVLEYPVVLIPLAMLGYVAPLLLEKSVKRAFFWVHKHDIKRWKGETKFESAQVEGTSKNQARRTGKYVDAGVQTELVVSLGRTWGEDGAISGSGKASRARSRSF